jgi:hypothetical protein
MEAEILIMETPLDIKPALHLPKDLKDRILTDQRLSLHQKFVLFTLYYLDSKGKLDEYGSYVPHFLNLREEDFKKNIDNLVRHNYLRFDNESLSLNIRPLRYNPSLSV